MTRSRIALLMLAPVAAVSLSGCGVNSIPTAEEKAKKEWADVEAAFQRRANLVNNLVATVKAAANIENKTLTQITEARASATQIKVSPDQLNDPEAMRRFAEAQSRLSAAILPLQRMQEAYPELKSQGNFPILMSELEGMENRINVEIGDYNEAVQAYNTTIRTFPAVIGAKVIYGSKPLQPYHSVTPNAEVAPTANFDGNSQ
jgi:LemA protein